MRQFGPSGILLEYLRLVVLGVFLENFMAALDGSVPLVLFDGVNREFDHGLGGRHGACLRVWRGRNNFYIAIKLLMRAYKFSTSFEEGS